MIQSASIRRTLAVSMLAHAAALLVLAWAYEPRDRKEVELVDIEVAPPPPPVEALPEEIAKAPEPSAPQADVPEAPLPPEPPGDLAVDAGIDAAIDAAPDAAPPDAAPPDAAPPDAAPAPPPDAGIEADAPLLAVTDAAVAPDDAAQVALVDPGVGSQGAEGSAAGSGSDAAAGSGAGSGSGSAVAGLTTQPAVEGAPTTAGTAANLLTYFPQGHITTLLIRFDRLRGTEWAQSTERLLRPMPDYRVLFGVTDARIAEKLDTMVISTPEPSNAAATTLVARTRLPRGPLRGFLGATSPVTWSPARGGLLGRRKNPLIPQDRRVFLSPFKGWFLLAQPGDLPGLIAPAQGDLDQIEATGKLPAWLAGIRTIEAESGETRGPALVMTLALAKLTGAAGKRMDLGDNDFGLGVKSFPVPERLSLAAEAVTQGWLVRGNILFAGPAAAAEFVGAAEAVRQRVGDSRILQSLVGKPAARVIANLSFAQSGARVSYSTSISIADMRAIMAVAAQQLDAYFAARMPAAP